MPRLLNINVEEVYDKIDKVEVHVFKRLCLLKENGASLC